MALSSHLDKDAGYRLLQATCTVYEDPHWSCHSRSYPVQGHGRMSCIISTTATYVTCPPLASGSGRPDGLQNPCMNLHRAIWFTRAEAIEQQSE